MKLNWSGHSPRHAGNGQEVAIIIILLVLLMKQQKPAQFLLIFGQNISKGEIFYKI
jgi:hypothetical protein